MRSPSLRLSLLSSLCLYATASLAASSDIVAETQVGDSLLDRLGGLFAPLLPSGSPDSPIKKGGLFGSGGSLLWGEGSLEVVRTQALYATRPAAFGPHIATDEGLKGLLVPISEYWNGSKAGNDTGSSIDPAYGCPIKGALGPKESRPVMTDDDEDYWLSVACAKGASVPHEERMTT
jgi:hypothetical protein